MDDLLCPSLEEVAKYTILSLHSEVLLCQEPIHNEGCPEEEVGETDDKERRRNFEVFLGE